MKPSEQELRALLARERARLEKQRVRTATRMHNDVSQRLTALTMELALLEGRLGAEHPEASKVASLLKEIGEANRAVRDITSQLHPKILDEFGLVAALQSECRRLTTETGIRYIFASDAQDIPHSQFPRTDVFRSFQEIALVFARGERASEVVVSLKMLEQNLRISLACNGKPPIEDPLDDEIVALDLLSVHERVAWIGGRVAIQKKNATHGMTITFIVPRQEKISSPDRSPVHNE